MLLNCVTVGITRRGVKIARFFIFTFTGGYPTYFLVIHWELYDIRISSLKREGSINPYTSKSVDPFMYGSIAH